MNRSAKAVLRKLGQDASSADAQQQHLQQAMQDEQARAQKDGMDTASSLEEVPNEMLTESEKRHEQYRRRQAMAGRFPPAAERLPIMTQEQRQERDKDRPKRQQSTFEGPIEKLVEKYGDLTEVQKHLTLGQSMKYEFTDDGRILDREGKVLYDGDKFV